MDAYKAGKEGFEVGKQLSEDLDMCYLSFAIAWVRLNNFQNPCQLWTAEMLSSYLNELPHGDSREFHVDVIILKQAFYELKKYLKDNFSFRKNSMKGTAAFGSLKSH